MNKDGIQWAGADIYIKLKGSSDPNDQHIITNAAILQNIKPGVYEIIVNSKNTGKTVTVRPGRDDAAAVINYYTLTLTTSTGIGSVTGDGVYIEGEVVTIIASTAYNYIFSKWTAEPSGIYGDLSKQNTVITMPGYTLELTASATFSAGSGNSGNGLSNIIIIPEQGGKVTATPSYPGIGDKVTVTVKPDAGYELDRLIITDEYGKALDFIDNGDGTYSYRQPAGVVTIDAAFKENLIDDTGSGDSDNKGDPGDEPSEIKLADDKEQSTDIPNDTEQSTNIPDETEQVLNTQKENGAGNNLVSDGGSNTVKDNEPKTGDNSFPLNIVIMLGSIAFIIRMLMDKKSRNRIIKRRILGFKPNE